MFFHEPAQILALTRNRLRTEKMINIGGRPVIVPQPRPTPTSHDRGETIKLALAFAAIYLGLGLDLPGDSLRS